MKTCTKCKQEKPLSEFYRNRTRKDGYDIYCKPCANVTRNISRSKSFENDPERFREYWRKARAKPAGKLKRFIKSLKDKYNMTHEEYTTMLLEQGNRCAICHCDFSKLNDTHNICVDHNHITGKNRGLLCTKCNLGIGNLRSDEGSTILMSAVKYTEERN